MSLPRVAVVGAGHMGRYHARKFAELAREGLCELAGICDVDPERAQAVASEHGARVLSDSEAVRASASAVCVAVPTGAHADVAVPFLEAGMGVFLEKPLAATRDEARRLIEAQRRGAAVLQVGHVERFSPALREVLPVIRSPRFIEAHRIGPYAGRGADVSVVLDLMIHDLDIVSELAGAEVESVDAIGVPVLSVTEDIANARVRFANGCVLNLTASRVSLEPLRKIRLFQPDAYISMDFAAHRITVARRLERAAPGQLPKIDVQEIRFDPQDALLEQDRAFVKALRGECEPLVSAAEGYRALELALRIQEAIPPMEDLG